MENLYMCQNNCLYRTYLLQALVRKNWLEVTINSLRILIEIETVTGGIPISRWGLFNRGAANARIELASSYLLQANNDIVMCENTLRIGCQGCFPQWKKETKTLQNSALNIIMSFYRPSPYVFPMSFSFLRNKQTQKDKRYVNFGVFSQNCKNSFGMF